jgi:hypothetical protein
MSSQSIAHSKHDSHHSQRSSGHRHHHHGHKKLTRPVVSAEALAADSTTRKLSELNARASRWIARGRKANRTLGKIFNKIKALVGHGKWQDYFEKHFEHRGIEFRTAERYMCDAREADTLSKNVKVSNSVPASDRQAKAINKATAHDEAAVVRAGGELSASKKPRVRQEVTYVLRLRMTGVQKTAIDALRNSPLGPAVEAEIKATLLHLCKFHGFLPRTSVVPTEQSAETSHETSTQTVAQESVQ